MNHQEWIKLTPQQQNEKVRNCLGFDKVYEKGWWGGYYWKRRSDGYQDINDRQFISDLNAMHEAEKLLGLRPQDRGWSTYMAYLHSIVTGSEEGYSQIVWHATSSQRAEAFVIAMEQT